MPKESYARFEKLLKEHNLTAYKISKITGISTATLTNWKKGIYIPKPDKLEKIADVFSVSESYIRTGKEPDNKERAKIDVMLARQNIRIKEYMIKFANLPEEKRNQIMSLIDMLEEK